MKTMAWHVRFLAVGAAVFLLGACEVDQVDEGEMPDVEVEEGEAPEYDVDGPEVDVRSDTDTVVVETPEVDVDVPDDETEE
ncbi:MAG: hypothetical protein ACODAB_06795 [Gemmatimonadota bacterium]